MSLNDLITEGMVYEPPKILFYGIEGIGKSTIGSLAEKPIILDIEGGTGSINTARIKRDKLKTYEDIMQVLVDLETAKHNYKTVVIDSLDWMERKVVDYTCREKGIDHLSKLNFGEGYTASTDNWRLFTKQLDRLKEKRGMTIVIIAHAKVAKVKDPESEAYDAYQIGIRDADAKIIQEWCDSVIFLNYESITKKVKEGFGETIKATGTSRRMAYTAKRPTSSGKSRYEFPKEIVWEKKNIWSELNKYLPKKKGQKNGKA